MIAELLLISHFTKVVVFIMVSFLAKCHCLMYISIEWHSDLSLAGSGWCSVAILIVNNCLIFQQQKYIYHAYSWRQGGGGGGATI